MKIVKILLLVSIFIFLGCEDTPKDDPCDRVTCSNHGKCIIVEDKASCECDPSYHLDGLTCIEDILDSCKDITCSNHGDCIVENNLAKCNCEAGYKAENLTCVEDSIDLCKDFSCGDMEHCIIENDLAKCICNNGYHLDDGHCVIDENSPCKDFSCGDMEHCIVENDLAKCICNDDFHKEGDSCIANKKIVDCLDNAPENGESIIDVVEISWSTESNSWEEVTPCVWSCKAGFKKEGESCIEESSACRPVCKDYEECDTRPMTPVCRLKDGRCNNDHDCTDMICDEESNFCYPAKKTWSVTPSANGFGTILFNETENKITTYYPHIYRKLTESGDATPNLAYDVYFGIRVDGVNKWLNEVDIEKVEYITGTGIIKVTKNYNNIEIYEYYFMTMLADAPIAVAGIEVINKNNDAKNISIFALGNFRVGVGEEHKLTEKADYDEVNKGFYERNWQWNYSYYHIFFASGGDPDIATTNSGDYNPWVEVTNNNSLIEHKSAEKDDIALFYQKNLGLINKDQKSSYFVAFNGVRDANGVENIAPVVKSYIADKSFETILSEEKTYWENWHNVETLPDNMTEREQKLAIQSSAFIKMGQVREDINGFGQILASLPPGGWNISWIRDMSYAVVGMIKANHMTESVDALEFIFGNRVNTGHYQGDEWNRIGHDYQISVCRYYADGTEETDWNDWGPNIEYDGFGLALWILDEYILANNNDTTFLTQYQTNIFTKTADILVSLIDDDNLISPDSSIWEYHWRDDGYNGKRHFAYTSITAYRGLIAAKRLGDLIGIDTTSYATAAARLKTGIETHLVKNSILTNFKLEDISTLAPENGRDIYNIDASSVEAFNFGVFEPNSEIASNTLEAFKQELSLESGSPGFSRTNKKCREGHASCVNIVNGVGANDYDIKEWIMVDFRVLEFLRERTDQSSLERADKLYNWILTQSELNNYQIAELYDEESGDYSGSVPMCGFGPGAYLIDLNR